MAGRYIRNTRRQRRDVKAIDLFCGAGGLTHGLRRAGWDVVLGIDVDAGVAETYEYNNPGTRFMAADLRAVREDDIWAQVGRIPREELLIAGCAPCQPFSKQRRRTGIAERSDASLLLEFARLGASFTTEGNTDGKRP